MIFSYIIPSKLYENSVCIVYAIYPFLLSTLLNPMINFEAILHSMHCDFFQLALAFWFAESTLLAL